jgi:hypothetical protein
MFRFNSINFAQVAMEMRAGMPWWGAAVFDYNQSPFDMGELCDS